MAAEELTQVDGVGEEKAEALVDAGYETVADLEDVGIPPADAPRLHARVAETAAMIS